MAPSINFHLQRAPLCSYFRVCTLSSHLGRKSSECNTCFCYEQSWLMHIFDASACMTKWQFFVVGGVQIVGGTQPREGAERRTSVRQHRALLALHSRQHRQEDHDRLRHLARQVSLYFFLLLLLTWLLFYFFNAGTVFARTRRVSL